MFDVQVLICRFYLNEHVEGACTMFLSLGDTCAPR